jgi:hypothetical protein
MRKRKVRTKFKPRRRQRIQNDAAPSGVEQKPEDANPRPPPPPLPPYYTKAEVLAFVRRTWPALWNMIRHKKFPEPHELFGEPIWDVDVVQAWRAALPVRTYKPLEETEDAE